MVVEAFANGSSGMNHSELLVSVACFLYQRGLQAVEDHAESCSGSGALSIVLVGFAVHILLQNNVRTQRQRRLQILRNGDNAHTLLLADVQNREQFLGLTAAGCEHHYIAFAKESGCTVYGFSRGDETGRTLNAAEQVREVLADDAGMAASAGSDALCAGQQFHCLGEGIFIKIIHHVGDAFRFDLVGFLCLHQRFFFHNFVILRVIIYTVCTTKRKQYFRLAKVNYTPYKNKLQYIYDFFYKQNNIDFYARNHIDFRAISCYIMYGRICPISIIM